MRWRQVPQILLDHLGGTVLVTQPRRVAAVSLARRVASERGGSVGGEVGYHIGQERRSTTRTRLLFCTCGLLLEELRTNGVGALQAYRFVVIDEVHERSVESDLCLAYVKLLLSTVPACPTKFVLMSATFDSKRYKDFFSPCLGRQLDVVAIADRQANLDAYLYPVATRYLEDSLKLATEGMGPAAAAAFESDVTAALAGPMLRLPAALQLVARLVARLHRLEPHASDRHIIVFLPTYRSLEECHTVVQALGLPLDVHALHSSTDTESCNRAIEETRSGSRKLVLATNVAESSLTIRNIAYVIDLCRCATSAGRPS